LNAPQADDEATDEEESNPFGKIADNIEDPPSEFFEPPNPNKIQEQPQSYGSTPAPATDPTLAAWQAQQRQLQLQQQQMLQQQQQTGAQPSPRLPFKWLIVVGVFVICLLIGLIVAVTVALGRSNDESGGPVPNVQQPPSLTKAPVVPQITPPPKPPTPAPTKATLPPGNLFPTPDQSTFDPKTTLGRIRQLGFLRCGVPVDQPGFATVNVETGKFEGFDVDMVRWNIVACRLCMSFFSRNVVSIVSSAD
jgi:hypothetical protein